MISLVPVRETEARPPADRGVRAGAREGGPSGRPRDVAETDDPAPVPDGVRLRGGRRSRAGRFDDRGQNVDLDVLAQVPADAAWRAETEEALKGLGFL